MILHDVCLSDLLSMIISRAIHVAAIGFILLFYGWVRFIYRYTRRSFLIHSTVGGHLGCCHVLAIVNSTAKNIGVRVPFRIHRVLSGYVPRCGITRSYDMSIFFLKEPANCSPQWLYQITFPPTVWKGSLLTAGWAGLEPRSKPDLRPTKLAFSLAQITAIPKYSNFPG